MQTRKKLNFRQHDHPGRKSNGIYFFKSAITMVSVKLNSYSNIFFSRIHWIFYLDDHVVWKFYFFLVCMPTEKRVSKDEMAEWHHQHKGHELGQTSGYDEAQGGLACWNPWGHRVGHDWTTQQLLLSALIMADQQTFLCSRHTKKEKRMLFINSIMLLIT